MVDFLKTQWFVDSLANSLNKLSGYVKRIASESPPKSPKNLQVQIRHASKDRIHRCRQRHPLWRRAESGTAKPQNAIIVVQRKKKKKKKKTTTQPRTPMVNMPAKNRPNVGRRDPTLRPGGAAFGIPRDSEFTPGAAAPAQRAAPSGAPRSWPRAPRRVPSGPYDCGSKSNHQIPQMFACVHLPGFHFGPTAIWNPPGDIPPFFVEHPSKPGFGPVTWQSPEWSL